MTPLRKIVCAVVLVLLSTSTVWGQALTLSWGDGSTDENGFRCERQTGGGSFSQVCDVGANVLTYQDTTISYGIEYCYRVKAYNAVGDSTYGSTVCGTAVASIALTQVSSRFECFGGTEATPDCAMTLNVGITIPPNACTRLRGQISNTGTATGSFGSVIYAQRNGSGGYTAVPNGPCLSTGICFTVGTGRTPPELGTEATTERLAGAGTFVPGRTQLSAMATPDVSLAPGQKTENVPALCVGAGNIVGDYFDVQWRRTDGTVLEAYIQIPRITIGNSTADRGVW